MKVKVLFLETPRLRTCLHDLKSIDISQHIAREWLLLAKRWVVERTFAWFNHFRRFSKDYEITVKSAENMVMIAHSILLLKKLN